ncbi:hypothetical protein HZB60_12195 [candidate division KSB1 bacterium]|nr:hypothetical protein [candidate division KSB1 bacterium]
MQYLRTVQCLCAFLSCGLLSLVYGGVTNPDISVIGQMRVFNTADTTDPNHDRGQFAFDETELVFDAYLNPYAKGTFVFAVVREEGIEVEEGFFQIMRGLPQGFAIKAGKYRTGFGKLNPVHPHAYPFAERFGVLAEYLPGEESYNEIGGQLSYLLPLPGTLASTISVDVLQGNSFKVDADESGQARPAVLGRWSNFFTLHGESSMEIGLSATQGTNHAVDGTTTTATGADAKAKLWLSSLSSLTLQAEFLGLNREYAAYNDEGVATGTESLTPNGGYFFADLSLRKRYNVGFSIERYQQATDEQPWNQSLGVFAGVALMEESTLFRLVLDHNQAGEGQDFNTITVQAVFSMGPHKVHQF